MDRLQPGQPLNFGNILYTPPGGDDEERGITITLLDQDGRPMDPPPGYTNTDEFRRLIVSTRTLAQGIIQGHLNAEGNHGGALEGREVRQLVQQGLVSKAPTGHQGCLDHDDTGQRVSWNRLEGDIVDFFRREPARGGADRGRRDRGSGRPRSAHPSFMHRPPLGELLPRSEDEYGGLKISATGGRSGAYADMHEPRIGTAYHSVHHEADPQSLLYAQPPQVSGRSDLYLGPPKARTAADQQRQLQDYLGFDESEDEAAPFQALSDDRSRKSPTFAAVPSRSFVDPSSGGPSKAPPGAVPRGKPSTVVAAADRHVPLADVPSDTHPRPVARRKTPTMDATAADTDRVVTGVLLGVDTPRPLPRVEDDAPIEEFQLRQAQLAALVEARRQQASLDDVASPFTTVLAKPSGERKAHQGGLHHTSIVLSKVAPPRVAQVDPSELSRDLPPPPSAIDEVEARRLAESQPDEPGLLGGLALGLGSAVVTVAKSALGSKTPRPVGEIHDI